MKKFLALILTVLTLLGTLALTSCEEQPSLLRLGMGVDVSYKDSSDADGENAGKTTAVYTVAAVLLDKKGRIVQCEIDCAEVGVSFTADGTAKNQDYKTKEELGYDYGMKNWANATEWFLQADAFEESVKGMTYEKLADTVTDKGQGNDKIMSAGCTIVVTEFVRALQKALKDAEAAEPRSYDAINADDVLSLGVQTTSSTVNATADTNGISDIETSFCAAVKSKDGKLTALKVDEILTSPEFTADGKAVYDTTKAIKTANESGNSDWKKQAEDFEALCDGKTADELEKADTDMIRALSAAIKALTK